MNFYLEKYGFCPPYITNTPSSKVGTIIVIPCFNEPDLVRSLQSLKHSTAPNSEVEVIVVLNSSEIAQDDVLAQNQSTQEEFDAFINEDIPSWISFHLIHSPNLPKKHAGVGLARKIGMDEAVSRFHQLNKDGIIVCFDADSLCERNYLVEIEKHFEEHPKSPGCSIHFEHPTDGNEFDSNIYEGIINYELHLRYYNQCFRFCELPYAFHTVGSSMAVRSSAYQKQGGMNKRKAGEDFYFLHKIIALGNFTELKSSMVIPSPRISDRVPFGTGKAIGDWVETGEKEYYTYSFEIFRALKYFLSFIPEMYKGDFNTVSDQINPNFKLYLENIGIENKLKELKSNTKDFKGFQKRFFFWFDAFQILKLVHYMQENGFQRQSINEAVNLLFEESLSIKVSSSSKDQLLALREIEKN